MAEVIKNIILHIWSSSGRCFKLSICFNYQLLSQLATCSLITARH